MEPENTSLQRKIIFQTIIFRFYVNLPGCRFIGKLLFRGVLQLIGKIPAEILRISSNRKAWVEHFCSHSDALRPNSSETSPEGQVVPNITRKLHIFPAQLYIYIYSWWFFTNPCWNIWVKMGSSSPISGVKIKQYLSCHHLVCTRTYFQRIHSVLARSGKFFKPLSQTYPPGLRPLKLDKPQSPHPHDSIGQRRSRKLFEAYHSEGTSGLVEKTWRSEHLSHLSQFAIRMQQNATKTLRMILLMVQKSGVQGFIHSRWCGISSINSSVLWNHWNIWIFHHLLSTLHSRRFFWKTWKRRVFAAASCVSTYLSTGDFGRPPWRGNTLVDRH